ncbi:AAA family ATPase [Pseudomonas gingeri]|uniref:AAA family ATPase n=1 Tax=Pseudomonas gingeri TaxID=117681 RepID=UPI0015A131BD|nr:AAA family ATPase [Pseudomonas gingeri]NVZ29681.1 AAA family ATPase [Pseudomonas gingeri]
MPTIETFTIKNFKGIEMVSVDLEDRIDCPVITLIGLNESGKTTILEALSHFVSGDKFVSALFDGVHSKTYGAALIPIHKKAAFSSSISISAKVRLQDEDINELHEIAASQKLELDSNSVLSIFEIRREYDFEDSVLKETNNIWNFKPKVRRSKKTAFKAYARPKNKDTPDFWLNCAEHLTKKLPQISYFPTFLVDMPSRIYLQEHEAEKPINRYYRLAFQNILNSLSEDLSVDRHVCQRIADYKASQGAKGWYSTFFGSPSKAPIDSVFQKISNAVTREVLGSWQRVFQRPISAKNIFVEWNVDSEKDDMPYASFHLSDGESRYSISERSLGFRWFFSFLLFTSFKQAQSRPTIFMFDEPAANLHAKAQAELLTSFSRIASGGNRVIYSTHSHHMINPRWLSGACIVENTAIDYDQDDNFGFNAKPTNVKLTKYREFVSKYPSRASYFQPVIEKLQYVSPEIIGTPPYVIVEGVSDYYALRIAQLTTGKKYSYSLIPGVGSGASGPLISQIMGRGENFVVLLDDDKAGIKERERYRSEWYLSDCQVLTISSVSGAYKGASLEALLGSEAEDAIKLALELKAKPSKKQIGWYLAERCAIADIGEEVLPASVLLRLREVLDFLERKFS